MRTFSKVSMILSAVLMIITGVIALCNPMSTFISLLWIIGILTLVSGILTLVFYFFDARGTIGSGTVLFSGISDIILGILFLNHGLLVAEIIAFIVGLWLTVFGVERFIRSFDLKKLYFKNWWLTLILGALCIVVGVLSMFSPLASAIVVSLVIGIGFIFYGVSLLVIFHTLKNASRDTIIYR